MISVEQATRLILSYPFPQSIEEVLLENSGNRVLAENLIADRDFPPFNRVAMDGIAIAFEAYESGQRQFPIQSVSAAGDPQASLSDVNKCIEIMTGAVLPLGTDTVIPYEKVSIQQGEATLEIASVVKNMNVHLKGSDRMQDDLIVKAPKILSPAEIGVAATVGRHHLKVFSLPKTLIVSTGNELVEIHEIPLPHQIRKSNVLRIDASLKKWGLEADKLHLLDDEEEVVRTLSSAVEKYDVILISGGVSKGKFDYVPEALEKIGAKKMFHRVRQRPGKPFWFGRIPGKTWIFAFPGNPVSSFISSMRYFDPWMRISYSLPPLSNPIAELSKTVQFAPDLTYFMQVKVSYQNGKFLATPIQGGGSGDLANLVDVDGFLELPAGRNEYKAGEFFRFFTFR